MRLMEQPPNSRLTRTAGGLTSGGLLLMTKAWWLGLGRYLYGTVIFLGAFLLFVVEPMAAKQLLPALGGSSAIWITCLVFFQVVLLFGYVYAHWLVGIASAKVAARLHITLLALAALHSSARTKVLWFLMPAACGHAAVCCH